MSGQDFLAGVGVKILTRDSVSAVLPGPARLALCGGVALYLIGVAAFALRMVGRLEHEKLAAAAALIALYAIGDGLAAWAVAAVVAALLGALCVAESDAARRVMSPRRRETSSTGSRASTKSARKIAHYRCTPICGFTAPTTTRFYATAK